MTNNKEFDITGMLLDFTLPGYTNFHLLPNGSDIDVTRENLDEYIALLCDATVGKGVTNQIDSFRKGFNQIISVSYFDCFTSDEIMLIVGGEKDEGWDTQGNFCLVNLDVLNSIKADHGYGVGSRIILQFADMLSKFDVEERRLFLTFCTGSPRLPIGGFSALNPCLTVVRKTVDKNDNVNKCLPSVMTCAHYLKVPEYADGEVMRSRFLFAMKEGQNSFHLS